MGDWNKDEQDLPLYLGEATGTRHPHRRRTILISLGILAAILFGGRAAISYWVDLLWFRSLGYGEVFWKSCGLQWSVLAFFAFATFLFLFGAFLALAHTYPADLLHQYQIVIGGQPIKITAEPALRRIALVAALVLAGFIGATLSGDWPIFALFWLGPHSSGVTDPIFGKPLSFYLFTLPALTLLGDWLLSLAVMICILAGGFLLLTGGLLSRSQRAYGDAKSPWRGFSAAFSLLLMALALNVFLGRYGSLSAHHTIFEGATYTDAHVMLPGLLLVCGALLVGAVLAAVSATRHAAGRTIVGALLPSAICYGVLQVIGWYVGNFVVKPNELVREQPFIRYNIEGTRRAFGLDRFVQQEFPAETSVAAADPANNQMTLENIRLWDWHALQDTLRQVQEIRTYYDFPDIDIDRYQIDGSLREVMLAARELNIEKLPESSRNWINEKLVYTHGYGVTMNSVNGFTVEGLPTLMLSNMPVQSGVKSLNVLRPEIYFGELTDTDVYVKTRQKEFDYPQGQANSLTSYVGTGGIALGGFLRRIGLAFDRGDLGKLPFSDDVTPESRLLMRRNVRDRVTALAPFLTFDLDPYMVVRENGRFSWIMDAFTTSDDYPYASHYTVKDQPVNYVRNSVKVVIDAYDGTTTFYVFDPADPILSAYRRIFPTLFRDSSFMPMDLQKHIRYPELLFQLQSEVYGLYHMTDPAVFFNREDLWTVATEVGTGNNGEQTKVPMQPNYVLMKLPGEQDIEFIEILPFTPANRNNLIGWLAGRSDGSKYGTAVVYDFPKTRLVDGPQQIESRIDQNAQISGQLTLWNQQGSHVRRGSLLVIPTGRALLYAEPIYLQAQESPMPELRLVVLALQDRLAYGPTFEAALGSLFGGATSSLTNNEASQNAVSAQVEPPSQGSESLIHQAAKQFAGYQKLTSEGRLAEAGQELESLKRTIEELDSGKK